MRCRQLQLLPDCPEPRQVALPQRNEPRLGPTWRIKAKHTPVPEYKRAGEHPQEDEVRTDVFEGEVSGGTGQAVRHSLIAGLRGERGRGEEMVRGSEGEEGGEVQHAGPAQCCIEAGVACQLHGACQKSSTAWMQELGGTATSAQTAGNSVPARVKTRLSLGRLHWSHSRHSESHSL